MTDSQWMWCQECGNWEGVECVLVGHKTCSAEEMIWRLERERDEAKETVSRDWEMLQSIGVGYLENYGNGIDKMFPHSWWTFELEIDRDMMIARLRGADGAIAELASAETRHRTLAEAFREITKKLCKTFGGRMVTVIDRFRALGKEPSKRMTWAVGDIVRDKWEKLTGSLPAKVLRQKTNDGGSHCFAVYPEWFIPVIDEVILSLHAEDDRQRMLFE